MTKPQQTNEHMREVINHSTHTHLLNAIKFILTQTLEKLCKKRVHGKKDFNNLYFWNTLNITHHSILVWNISKRLHTIYKKHVHKERKGTTHEEIGETIRTTSIYIYIYISIRVQGLLSQCKNNVSKKKRKDTKSLHYIPQKIDTLPNKKYLLY